MLRSFNIKRLDYLTKDRLIVCRERLEYFDKGRLNWFTENVEIFRHILTKED